MYWTWLLAGPRQERMLPYAQQDGRGRSVGASGQFLPRLLVQVKAAVSSTPRPKNAVLRRFLHGLSSPSTLIQKNKTPQNAVSYFLQSVKEPLFLFTQKQGFCCIVGLKS